MVEIQPALLDQHIETMAQHLIDRLNAPSREAALRVAREEVQYTADLCETFSAGVWITVSRGLNDAGDAVKEHYRVYDRLMLGAHTL